MSKYDYGFKLTVVNAYLAGQGGYGSLAKIFGIKSPTNIKKWVNIFNLIVSWFKKWQSEGIEGLSKEKGRPSMSNKPKKKTTKKQLTKEQQLEKEVELLKVENAYLKKLRASGVNIPNRMLKQNPESSMNSEKNSN